MKKVSIGTILSAFGVLLGVVAMICLAGAGLYYKETTTTDAVIATVTTTVTSSAGLFGFVFGGHDFVTVATIGTSDPTTLSAHLDGGMSYFALIAFILVVLAIIVAVLSFFAKKQSKMLALIAGVLFVLGGVCMFMLKVAGTDFTATAGSVTTNTAWADYFKDSKYGLGVGAILYAIFAILGGLSVGASCFIGKKK